MDKFKEMKEKAIAQLGILAEQPVENTEDGVCHALKRIFNLGTWNDGAKAVMIVSHWMWANCEEAYHSMHGGEAK